jgi:Chalcone isomerase-like
MRRLTPLALLLSTVVVAAELNGVTAAPAVTVDGKALKLNGQGLRRKFIFDIYVANLYLETPGADGQAILARDEARRVDMTLLRDLDKQSIFDALKNGFEKNAGEKYASLKEPLEKFGAVITDLKKGQALTIVYVPGKGTRVEGQGNSYSAEGKEFADALFSVWIGRFPVDENLKKGMLGGK